MKYVVLWISFAYSGPDAGPPTPWTEFEYFDTFRACRAWITKDDAARYQHPTIHRRVLCLPNGVQP